MKGEDPRRLGGDIAGPGGPHEHGGVVIDTTNCVLLDTTSVAVMDPGGAICLKLSGRINKSSDRAGVLFLMDSDGAASVIVELMGLFERMSSPSEQESFLSAIRKALDGLP